MGENQRREMVGKVYQRSLHAEINVLFQSLKQYEKSNSFKRKKSPERPPMTIYVVRILNGDGSNAYYNLGKSYPCLNCQRYLHFHNITKIKYTDNIDGVNVLCELRANPLHKVKNIRYKITENPEYGQE